MGTSDGTILGTTKIVDNGDPIKRWNLVLVSEGYQNSEIKIFHKHAQNFINTLFQTAPFNDLKDAVNIHRIDVASSDSGADDPVSCSGTGATPATYFDASFCNNGIRRLLLVNNTTVINVLNAQVPQWHQAIVIINSTRWGGAGGTIGTTSVAAGWENIAIHELGHTAFNLADEYEYYLGCGIDTDRNQYSGGEPAAPNVTTDNNPITIKWNDLIDPANAAPTTSNPNCTQCDNNPSPVPNGTVGAFEGAFYHHCGVYRPEYNCMMRNLQDFCLVCQKQIRTILQPYLPN